MGSTARPKFREGDPVDCWMPNPPGETVASQYRCGNTDCVKMFDPQDDIDIANDISKPFWISGTVTIIVSIVILLISYLCCIRIPLVDPRDEFGWRPRRGSK